MGKGENYEKRDKVVPLRMSESEVKLLDAACAKRKLTNRWKNSRTDTIIAALKFANGDLLQHINR